MVSQNSYMKKKRFMRRMNQSHMFIEDPSSDNRHLIINEGGEGGWKLK